MLFNSFEFLVFFASIVAVTFLLSHRGQNWSLLAASYVFYGAWDVRFLLLIFSCTLGNYLFAASIARATTKRRRKLLVSGAVFLSLAALSFFKYYNFFVDSAAALLSSMGMDSSLLHVNIILPVGISFFTFQALSYVIDVYRERVAPCRSFADFALFVSFFPQLIAGPIERASHLLPQIATPRLLSWRGVSRGAALFLYGLFQKVVIADNLALVVDVVFSKPDEAGAAMILLSVYAFSFQIFCDFAGYSNMARGAAAMIGFELMVNFNAPYFARDPSDFWRRWHISLSRWLRDYLYIPLGGNRLGRGKTVRNLMLTMLLGGLWHGAAWTFVLWGGFHGMLLVAYRSVQEKARGLTERLSRRALHLWQVFTWAAFFHLVCLGWLLFRAESIGQAGALFKALATGSQGSGGPVAPWALKVVLPWSLAAMALQYIEYREGDFLSVTEWPLLYRTALYLLLFYGIVIFGVHDAQSFIYFQF